MRNDPVHVPSSELVVTYKGKEVILLNKALIDSQLCWHNLSKIKSLHVERLELYEEMSITDCEDLLRFYDALYSRIEYDLQAEWLFTQDSRFHRPWVRPKCQCPKMDNEDRYPHGMIVNQLCILHGL
jgi:hypothetical protein